MVYICTKDGKYEVNQYFHGKTDFYISHLIRIYNYNIKESVKIHFTSLEKGSVNTQEYQNLEESSCISGSTLTSSCIPMTSMCTAPVV